MKEAIFGKHLKIDVKELGSVPLYGCFSIILSEMHSRCCITQDNLSCLAGSSLRGSVVFQIHRHAGCGLEVFKITLFIWNLISYFIKIRE